MPQFLPFLPNATQFCLWLGCYICPPLRHWPDWFRFVNFVFDCCWRLAGRKIYVFWTLLTDRGFVLFILILFSTPIAKLIAVCSAWLGSVVSRSKWRWIAVSGIFVINLSLIILSSWSSKPQFPANFLVYCRIAVHSPPFFCFLEHSTYLAKLILQGLSNAASIIVQSSIVVNWFITACGSFRFKLRLPHVPMLK